MGDKFYITTPLYYINASPHIGHSYTNIAADVLARYYRQRNFDVYFLTGTDEHGQKIKKAAEDAGLEPQVFADKMVLQFRDLWKALDISYDDFIRTTEERHVNTVNRVLEILFEREEIYPAKYEGWYCLPCETFWTEIQCINQNCPDCKRPLDKISETNYFFRLKDHQTWLIEYIRNNSNFILPQIRRNEVLRFLELDELNDLCISRPKERLSWGISLPFSPGYVTYVWFDALINYISAVGRFDKQGRYISKWWPADLQLIGKDILRQHAIYWPIILYALKLELPKTIFAHGWWMVGETKMSKSRGNVISPIDMVERFGIDVYRYFLLRDVPFGLDGNFSEDAIIKRFNADLANDLGNLVYRTLTMIEKYFKGNVPVGNIKFKNIQTKAIEEKMKSLDYEITANSGAGIGYNFSASLESIWELINMANKYIEETKPWNLSKEDKREELKAFIRLLIDVIRKVAVLIYPFMPQTAELIKKQIGEERIIKGKVLFPRIETVNAH